MSEPFSNELNVETETLLDENDQYPNPHSSRVVDHYGVPRRFGIGTILVVMGAASILLAFLVAWGVPAPVVFHLVAFLVIIAFGQALFFRGTNPRRASVVTGAIICPLYAIVAGLIVSSLEENSGHKLEIFIFAVGFSIMGPLLGYLAGGVVGGIFLIMDYWEQRFVRKIVTESYDPFAPLDRSVEDLP